MSTTVLAILRTASRTDADRGYPDEVMRRRGLSLADRPVGRMMLARVHSCLRAQRKRKIAGSRKVGKAGAREVVR